MRRNNTLSWRWDYLSTWPVHCSRILFSLLIARIQHLAQDDPIYLHNLLFSLLLPLNSVWRGWKQKEIPPKICETYCSWTCREKKWEKKKRKRQRSLLPKNRLVMIIFIGDCEVFLCPLEMSQLCYQTQFVCRLGRFEEEHINQRMNYWEALSTSKRAILFAHMV